MPPFLSVLPALVGLALSVSRFRAGDDVLGLGAALAGMLLTIVVAIATGRRAE